VGLLNWAQTKRRVDSKRLMVNILFTASIKNSSLVSGFSVSVINFFGAVRIAI
jgi:hypothetical protein